MAQKKSSNLFKRLATVLLFATISSLSIHANEDVAAETRTIQLSSSDEFTLDNVDSSIFTIRPLKPSLRSIENLKDTEAVGITYLGVLTLHESATPLSALRDLSVQISSALEVDLALITDSTTSESLKPHEMLLLYHPRLVITLALTKVPDSDSYTLIGTYAIPVTDTQSDVIESPDSSE